MKITIAKGVSVKEIILEDGTPLVKVGHGLTGITVTHPFNDVQADLAEVNLQANLTFVTDHLIEMEVDAQKRCVVSDTKEIFFAISI